MMPNSNPLPSPSLDTRRPLLWITAAAIIVRLLYFTEHASSAFFGVAILDEKFYDLLARQILDGSDLSRLNPGFRPLLYPLFLAFFYHLGGESGPALAIAAQHVLGVLTVVLIAWLAMRLFERPAAGALAGALYLLAGPPLYFEGERLIASLFTFLIVLQLALIARAMESPKVIRWWLLAGCCAGLAIQARPNALLFLAIFPLATFASSRFHQRSMMTALASALVVHLAFSLLPLAFGAPWTALPKAGGINFYLGNKPSADGMIPRQDRDVVQGDSYRDSVQVFAEEEYREALAQRGIERPASITAGEISRYWYDRTFESIREEPGRWFALMGRKIRLLLWNVEVPNNKSYGFIVEHESKVLRSMPVRWWILLCAAPFGVALAWRGRQHPLLLWLLALLLLHSLGVLLFFVNARYRLPLWPGMAILAAGGVLALYDIVRRRKPRELATALALASGLAISSLTPPPQITLPSQGRDFFFRSLAYFEKGKLDAARADAERSVALDERNAAAHFQLGNVALAQTDAEAARRAFLEASRLKPGEPLIFNNLGVALEDLDRPAEAYASYRQAVSLSPDHAAAWVNLALLELRAGLASIAGQKIDRAAELGDDSIALLCARALLARAEKRESEATRWLDQARQRNPAAVRKILERHRQSLQPQNLRQ